MFFKLVWWVHYLWYYTCNYNLIVNILVVHLKNFRNYFFIDGFKIHFNHNTVSSILILSYSVVIQNILSSGIHIQGLYSWYRLRSTGQQSILLYFSPAKCLGYDFLLTYAYMRTYTSIGLTQYSSYYLWSIVTIKNAYLIEVPEYKQL